MSKRVLNLSVDGGSSIQFMAKQATESTDAQGLGGVMFCTVRLANDIVILTTSKQLFVIIRFFVRLDYINKINKSVFVNKCISVMCLAELLFPRRRTQRREISAWRALREPVRPFLYHAGSLR